MQATSESDADEHSCLISTDGTSYRVLSPVSTHGAKDSEEEILGAPVRQQSWDRGEGRYTPVPKSFNKTEDRRPSPVWKLPHKDYDVSSA